MLRGWLAEAGSDIELEFLVKFTDQTLTSVDHKDPWFSAMTSAFKKHNLNVRPQIFPAGTDSRYWFTRLLTCYPTIIKNRDEKGGKIYFSIRIGAYGPNANVAFD